MKKTLIGFITMLFGAGILGFGLGRLWPKLDEPIAIMIAVVGIIILLIGEIIFLKNQKR